MKKGMVEFVVSQYIKKGGTVQTENGKKFVYVSINGNARKVYLERFDAEDLTLDLSSTRSGNSAWP